MKYSKLNYVNEDILWLFKNIFNNCSLKFKQKKNVTQRIYVTT